jgi:hypothetical protein
MKNVIQNPRMKPSHDFNEVQDLIAIDVDELKSESKTVFGAAGHKVLAGLFKAEQHSLKIQMHLPMTICSIMQIFGYAFVGTKTAKPNLEQKLEG